MNFQNIVLSKIANNIKCTTLLLVRKAPKLIMISDG